METHCQATTKGGQRCKGTARPSGFCFSHDPDLQQARRDGQARGGENKRTEARITRLVPATLRPVLERLMGAVDEVYAGTLEPKQATAMASLAGAIGRLYETASLEQRLEAIEAAHEQNVG
jgi:hypothetical protein